MSVVLPESTEPSKRPSRRTVVLMTIVGFPTLCVVLLYLASGTMNTHWTPESLTRTNMMMIDTVFDNYVQENSALPLSSENYRLVQTFTGNNSDKKSYFTPNSTTVNANHEFIDGWGTPFRIRCESKDNMVIISAGPDKTFGTADDITNQ